MFLVLATKLSNNSKNNRKSLTDTSGGKYILSIWRISERVVNLQPTTSITVISANISKSKFEVVNEFFFTAVRTPPPLVL